MHQKRWLTALVLVPLVILVILKGGRAGAVLILLGINGLAHLEFLGFFQQEAGLAKKIGLICLGSLLLLSFAMAAQPRGEAAPLLVLVTCLFALFLFYLLNYGKTQELARDLAIDALGLLYVPFLLGHFIWLRYLPQGEWWILWLIAVVCSGDTAAYYSGKTWGKRKFYPRVSPGKTWAGTFGGLGANLAVGLLIGTLVAAWGKYSQSGPSGGHIGVHRRRRRSFRVHAQTPGPGQRRQFSAAGPRRGAGPPGQPAFHCISFSLCPVVSP